MNNKLFLLLTFLFAFSSSIYSMDDTYMFKHLNIEDGLSNNQINYIYEDSQGFIWFATASGLNRYDGYTFKVFTHDTEIGCSLKDNFIDDLQEDHLKNLWVRMSNSGYLIYDPLKENFDADVEGWLEKNCSLTNFALSLMYVDDNRDYWFYSEDTKELYYSNPNKKQLQKIDISDESIVCLTEDGKYVILACESGNLLYIDKDDLELKNKITFLSQKNVSGATLHVFIDRDEDLWAYGVESYGLWHYNKNTKTWIYFDSSTKSNHGKLSSDVVKDIVQDKDGLIWIATDHGGLNLLDKANYHIRQLTHDKFDDRSISHNSINCLFNDSNNMMWIGTYKKGVSYYHESVFKFIVNDFHNIKNASKFEADLNAIVADDFGGIWLGSNTTGLAYLPVGSNELILYDLPRDDAKSLSSNTIVALKYTSDKALWFGTYLGGFGCIKDNKLVQYFHKKSLKNSLPTNNIWALEEDEKGSLWVGTLGEGLLYYDANTRNVSHLSAADTDFSKDHILSICPGNDGLVYLGTANGLCIYNPTNKTTIRLFGNRSNTQSLSHRNINHIYEDSRGLLWLATQEGIDVYDRKKDTLIKVSDNKRLKNCIVYAIIEDDNKNMWASTTAGLYEVAVRYQPQPHEYSFEIRLFNELHGLQGRDFNYRSASKNKEGVIYFGNINGLNYFHPSKLKYNNIVPKIIFSNISMFNNVVDIDSIYGGRKILDKALHLTNHVDLNYNENLFSISFSALNYILPEKTKFRYKLTGFNTDWINSDDGNNKVTFTNLAPGNYDLLVEAINSDGLYSESPAMLSLSIHPPFWKTNWAYFIYLVVLIALLIYIRHIVLRKERSKFELLQIQREFKRKQELEDMKIQFFTNISHELKTPLTLILTPLEKLLSDSGDIQNSKLKGIYRNAQRLFVMVNQLLDFRKKEIKGLSLNLSNGDIISFIKDISDSFVELSEYKEIDFSLDIPKEALLMSFDQDKLGKILMNLLSNAFKFTPSGKSVSLSLQIVKNNQDINGIQLCVSDMGIGIPDEDKKNIFDRFYQVSDKKNRFYEGTGIGLHLVKEFVDLHHGEIGVSDHEGGGSVFTVHIPYQAPDNSMQDVELNEINQSGLEQKDLPRLLIVDDNAEFLQFMYDLLKDEFSVITSVSASEGLSILLDKDIDIVISDLMMPEMNGSEFCSKVKSDVRTSHIPFILLTAKSDDTAELKALENGADDYITKPFKYNLLLARVNNLLKIRNERQLKFKDQIDPNPEDITITSVDEKLINSAIEYVEKNISKSDLTVEELSAELGMSRVHLYNKLRSITGRTPIEFIRVIRIKRAAQLLRESQLNVSEIAYEVGFNNPKYFSKYFKEEFDLLPSKYKEKWGV